jgi:hypothetical protein
MPIIASDLMYKQSGAGNLGGAVSGSDVSTALHALFDAITGSESLGGDAEYRCVYVKNTHASLTLYNAVVFLQSNTPSASTSVAIGLGTSAINGTEQTIAAEGDEPSGVSFSSPSTYGAGLVIGDLAPGQTKAVWIRRTVTAGAAAYSGDSATLALQGDTAA